MHLPGRPSQFCIRAETYSRINRYTECINLIQLFAMAPSTTAKASIGKKNTILLHALCHLDEQQRASLLRTIDKNGVRSICECALNTLNGTVPLKKSERLRLSKHKKVLRRLVNKSGCWKSKKRVIVQKGSGFLLPLLLPIIGTVLSNVFARN